MGKRVRFINLLFVVFIVSMFFGAGIQAANAQGVTVTGNPTSESVELTFSSPLDPASVRDSFTLRVIIPGIGYGTVAGLLMYEEGGLKATFIPTSDLVADMNYSITMPGAKDPNGNPPAFDKWEFNGPRPDLITGMADLEYVEGQLAKLAPVTLRYSLSTLSPEDKEVVGLLKQAADYMHRAFLRQVKEDNEPLLAELEKYKGTEEQAYYDYFKLMTGPWDRLDDNYLPFINNMERPAGAGYYPAGMTDGEFDAWIEANPGDEAAFTDFFTMIRREGSGLKAVPYSEYFRDLLVPAADLLRQAAATTTDSTLATYLSSRADDLLADDYRQSDIDWIGLAGDIEVVIGPYETYEDELFGYKAAFESFICIVDQQESQKMESIEGFRDDLAANFPLPDGYDLTPKGLSSPIKVVNEIYATGDAGAGVRTIAFNLPNDEWVRENVGSKNVMLKNVMEAKFDGVLVPIAGTLLAESERTRISGEAFFNFVLMHEITHGLGPGTITVDGVETTVREQLQELYRTIEECQADTLGIYNVQYLIDSENSPMPEGLNDSLYATYLAGMFRSIRFGIGSAHGGGVAIQLNWHLENGGFKIDENGMFSVDYDKIKDSVRSLAAELLAIELTGDYDRAKTLMDTYRVVTDDVQAALDKLADIPTDIRPSYLDVTSHYADDDGDGYTEVEGDCNDANADIFPGTDEILNDGIDQNCDGKDEADFALEDYVTNEALAACLYELEAISLAYADTGYRLSGTPGYDAGLDYVRRKLEPLGYVFTEQPVEFRFFEELEDPVFEQASPNQVAYVLNDDFSTQTYSGSGNVTAEIGFVTPMFPPADDANTSTDGCEVEDFAGIDLTEKIAVIQRGNCAFADKAQNAQNAGAVGVIIFNEGQEGRQDQMGGTLGNESDISIPVIATSYPIATALYELAQTGTVEIHMDVSTSDDTRVSNNLITETPGGNSDQVILVGAHMDSVSTAPGTNDNGTGSVAILELAYQMAQQGFNPVNKVRFAWWAIEEQGTVGSGAYLGSLSEEELAKIGLYLNVDMIGSHNYALFVHDGNVSHTAENPATADDMAELVLRPESGAIEQVFLDYFDSADTIVFPGALSGRSDYDNFVYYGIPVGGVDSGGDGIKTEEQVEVYGGTAGEQYDECYHRLCDTMENLNMDAMTSISKSVAHTAQYFAQDVKLFDDLPPAPRKAEKKVERTKERIFKYDRSHSDRHLYSVE
ncbi:MAG: M20/M25/M40 family metallo-hydrolase [Desulfobacteraceae bacterium]|nr:M20/M25/M40 family metallo-hydrolase [Desulfobacteraceae bacterium]